MNASSNQKLSKLACDITECPICSERFKQPKCLPCIHTFCLECLVKYGKTKLEGATTCPLCRQKFDIPDGGFEKLPGNFFIEQLLTFNDSLKKINCFADQKNKCDECLDLHPDQVDACSIALAYCTECRQSLCSDCLSRHRKIKSTQTHNVISSKEKRTSSLMMTLSSRPSYCSNHKDELIKFYCYDCDLLICAICVMVGGHKKHNCSDVRDSAKKFKEELRNTHPDMDACLGSSRSELELLNGYEKQLGEVQTTQETIRNKAKEVKCLVDRYCEQLVDELNDFKSARLKSIEMRRSDVDCQMLIVESYKRYVDEIINKGSPCDISRSAKELLNKNKIIRQTNKEFGKRMLNEKKAEFKAAHIRDCISSRTYLLGSTSTTDSTSKSNAVQNRSRNMKLISVALILASVLVAIVLTSFYGDD